MTTTPGPDARTLLILLRSNGWFLDQNLDGVTHDESLVRPRPAGSPLNWVLGHIVYWRRRMLALLGDTEVEDGEGWEIYDSRADGARPWTPADAQGLDALKRGFQDAQTKLARALESETASEHLASSHAQGTVADRMLKLLSHEMYHVGQTGLLRRLLGHEGAV